MAAFLFMIHGHFVCFLAVPVANSHRHHRTGMGPMPEMPIRREGCPVKGSGTYFGDMGIVPEMPRQAQAGASIGKLTASIAGRIQRQVYPA